MVYRVRAVAPLLLAALMVLCGCQGAPRATATATAAPSPAPTASAAPTPGPEQQPVALTVPPVTAST